MTYAGDFNQPFHKVVVRLKEVIQSDLHTSNTVLEMLNGIEMFLEKPAAMLSEESLDRAKKLRAFALEFTTQASFHILLGYLGRRLPDEEVHQVAASTTEEVGDNRIYLNVAGFEKFVDTPFYVTYCLHETLSVTRQVPPLAHILRRNKCSPDKPHSQQSGDPLAVGHIRLPTRQILDVPGIDQDHLKVSFQYVVDRTPIYAGALHRHNGAVMRLQPVS
jgi:hypothetical protein